jgi:uncharacterized protein YndB with AHSA1/START domain
MKNIIYLEHIYPVSREKVWKALTELSQMKQWFFPQLETFRPEQDFETVFNVEHHGKVYPHIWRILDIVPNEKLKMGWKFGGYPGNSTVLFELQSEGSSTRLSFEHEGIDSFPQDNPDFSYESHMQGWTELLGKNLKQFLEKKS